MASRKRRKKPCSICGRWFLPDARLGIRQRTCGSVECRAACKAKSQASWRKRNPDYQTDRRLRAQVEAVEREPADHHLSAPPAFMAAIPWGLVKTLMGAKTAVATAFLLRMVDYEVKTLMGVRNRMPGESRRRMPAQGRKTLMEGSGGGADNQP